MASPMCRDLGEQQPVLAACAGADDPVSRPHRCRMDEVIDDTGYQERSAVRLTDEQLLENIRDDAGRKTRFICPTTPGRRSWGAAALDVEMETGTGKTYVYIKTMFELNKRYGWSKFIVVVPSIAIREGVKKSFEITVDHFMEHYGKKARFFIYNSKQPEPAGRLFRRQRHQCDDYQHAGVRRFSERG